MMATSSHCPHFLGQFPERTPRFLYQSLAQDFAMLGFRRTAVLGRPPFQPGDQLVVEIPND
jgi:hypothetical protein